MNEDEKRRVLEEWQNIKRMGRVTARFLWSLGRWILGTVLLWDVISQWWKK